MLALEDIILIIIVCLEFVLLAQRKQFFLQNLSKTLTINYSKLSLDLD